MLHTVQNFNSSRACVCVYFITFSAVGGESEREREEVILDERSLQIAVALQINHSATANLFLICSCGLIMQMSILFNFNIARC